VVVVLAGGVIVLISMGLRQSFNNPGHAMAAYEL